MPFSTDNDAVTALVAAALFAPTPTELLTRATALARSTTQRQLVAIASAYVAGDADRVRMLASDHTAEPPGDVLLRWMVATTESPTTTGIEVQR